jgi:hypothetical protein
MMAAIDHDRDELPAPIADALVDVGVKPEIATLLRIISDFAQNRDARIGGNASNLPRVEQWPLKSALPSNISYEVARKACERGELGQKIGGRWFMSSQELARWIAQTGRGKRGA